MLKGGRTKVYCLEPQDLREKHHGEFPGFSLILYPKLQSGEDTINLETPTGKDQENPPSPILFSLVKDQEKSNLSRIENLYLII